MKKRGMKASLWLLLALRNHCFLILHFLYGAQRLEDKLGVVVHACNSSYLRSRSRMIKAPVQPWKSMKPYLKKKQKMAGDKNQVAEHLPSNLKALSSNPSTNKIITITRKKSVSLLPPHLYIYQHLCSHTLMFLL
jgi:hypothetical protein